MVYESLILLLPNCRFMVQLHPLAHAQFVGKAHRSETKFEKGASDRNSRTGFTLFTNSEVWHVRCALRNAL